MPRIQERELKLVLDEPGERRLIERLHTLDLMLPVQDPALLRTIYFDTPEHDLGRSHIALRLRNEGTRWTQTVKVKTQHHAGLFQALELDSPVPEGRLHLEAIPDTDVRQKVLDLINAKPLEPICETRINRTRAVVRQPDGARIEVAVDSGEICAQRHSVPFREAELELIEGHVGALFDLAHRLFPTGGLHVSALSKAERGYLLAATGRIDLQIAPRRAARVPLDRDQTAETAARDILRECFDQIAGNALLVGRSDSRAGPRQLRIGLRRLRCALAMFRPVLLSPEADRLGAEAKWLGQVVGDLRDLDVALTDILAPAAKACPEEPGFDRLIQAVGAQRDQTRARIRALLADIRTQAFLIDLARFIETRGWLVEEDFAQSRRLAAPIPETAGTALDKRWKSVCKHAKGIRKLDIPARHALRKELRKLRETTEFMGPLWKGKQVKPFVTRLKALQALFDDLNDAAMIETVLLGDASPIPDDAAAQRTAGWLLGMRMARAETGWQDAHGLWHDLKDLGPFWASIDMSS